MTQTEARTVALLREHLGTSAYPGLTRTDVDDALDADTRLDATFAEDLRMDSLDLVEITMASEDEFGIEITDDEAAGFGPNGGKSVKDWAALIDDKLAAKAGKVAA